MKLSTLLLFILTNAEALAKPSLCTTWPDIRGATGPSVTLSKTPFTYNFRLDCDLGDAFELLGVYGAFHQYEGNQISYRFVSSSKNVISYQLPSGETLYQHIFVAPAEEHAGDYQFGGCLMVRDLDLLESRCLEMPALKVKVVPTLFNTGKL